MSQKRVEPTFTTQEEMQASVRRMERILEETISQCREHEKKIKKLESTPCW
ncbi:MAG: hypothetical protein ABIG66_00225 [Candidatus Kerfeldbacteria bacterium]